MDTTIGENLPCFCFPDEFISRLPHRYEPLDVEKIDDRSYRNAVLELRGSVYDYVVTYQADIIRGGILREVRQYEDGTCAVRFDTSVLSNRNVKEGDFQFVMHLDGNKHLLHYTIVFPEMKPASSYAVELFGKNKMLRMVETLDDMMSLLRTLEIGKTVFVGPSSIAYRSLRITRHLSQGNFIWSVKFYYEHLPFSFRLPVLNERELRRILGVYMARGLLGLCHDPSLKYWNPDSDDEPGACHIFPVYPRLLLHRAMAGFLSDNSAIALLDEVQVFDTPGAPPLWMSRKGASWEEMVSNLYRIARGEESLRVDAYKNKLSELDCDRLVAFAALEGCPEAISELGMPGKLKIAIHSEMIRLGERIVAS